MRIRVKADGHSIFLPIPSCLLMNPLSALLVCKFAAPHVAALSGLTYAQTRALMHALSRAKRKLRGKPLVDVKGGNGEQVYVYL